MDKKDVLSVLLGGVIGVLLGGYVRDDCIKSLDSLINDRSGVCVAGSVEPEFEIPLSHYLRVKTSLHTFTSIADKVDTRDPFVAGLAKILTKGVYSDEEKAQKILDFVNTNIAYSVKFEEYGEYIKHPVETLVEREGDCEDTSILAASLLGSIGVKSVIVTLHGKSNFGHVVVGVAGDFDGYMIHYRNTKYYLAETTGSSKIKIGDLSEKFSQYTVSEVIPVF